MSALQLYRFRLTLLQPAAFPGNGAEQAHGLLFHLLAAHNPDLSAELHNRADKPFSLSPVRAEDGSTALTFNEGAQACFQVGALSAPLISALAAITPREVRLGNTHARLEAIEPLLPRPASYESLFDYRALPKNISLRFLTPTSFRRLGEQILLPEPGLVFGSLLSRFNAHSPFPFPAESRAAFERLRVSRYDLRTSAVEYGRYKIIGFTGRITFTFPTDFPPQMAYLSAALARFARFSGVGYKTTMGLGQTEPVEER